VNHGFFNQNFLYRILADIIRIYGKGLPSNDERPKKRLLRGAVEEAIQHLFSLGLPNVSPPTLDDVEHLIEIFYLQVNIMIIWKTWRRWRRGQLCFLLHIDQRIQCLSINGQ
jgi:hypothetical protein